MPTKTPTWADLAIPPGEILADELAARRLTQAELARRMGRPVQTINMILKGKKAITAETALDLERVLKTPAHVWLNLQAQYELTQARLAAGHHAGGSRGTALVFGSSSRHTRRATFVFAKRKATQQVAKKK